MIKILLRGMRYSARLLRHFVKETKLLAWNQLRQDPPHLSYWYDPIMHTLVGLHVGLDLHRRDGKYHVIETNLYPSLRPERRALYDTPLDPMISTLIDVARSHGFERLVFCLPIYLSGWPEPYLHEFQFASRQSGLEVLGLPLPQRFSAKTIYVVGDHGGQRLLGEFVHDKYWSAKWLKETIDSEADEIKLLTYVPTFDHLVLPPEPSNPGWPNLVIKLSDVDCGQAVVFGRFRNREEARRALCSLPDAFAIKWHNRFFHRRIYQPFIGPEVLDKRPRCIRLHSFISPLFDTFLSAHARIGRIELPDRIGEGLVEGKNPFLASFSAGDASYAGVEPEVEEELRLVTEEFGRVANIAINRKFQTAPNKPMACSATIRGQ
jgi:hypothetical protein